MKKTISLIVSFLLVFSAIPNALYVNAEVLSNEKVIISFEEETKPEVYNSKSLTAAVRSDGKYGFDGSYVALAFSTSKDAVNAIGLPSGWQNNNPIAIKFWAQSSASTTMRVALGTVKDSDLITNVKSSDATKTDTITSTGAWYELNIENADISNVNYIGFGRTSASSVGIYIDNITLVYSSVIMKNGAAIRLNEMSGIRFSTTVNTEKLDELKAVEGNVVELGTLIAPADLVTDELTHEMAAGNFVDIPYKSQEFFEENTFVGSIVAIKPANYGRAFIGRGYVKVTNGEKVTYHYATQNDNIRSVKTIATALINDTSESSQTLYNEHKDIVDVWASAADWTAE